MALIEGLTREALTEEQSAQQSASSKLIGEPLSAETSLAPPIKSRFLYVNVAGKRALQLRRGAKPRVEVIEGRRTAERLAMEEINCGLIPYEVAE